MGKVKIDIVSDLHFDAYFDDMVDTELSRIKALEFYNPYFANRDADILLIAGDIGHCNHQSLNLLKLFKEHYYKSIILILGNHDYFLSSNCEDFTLYKNSFERVNAFETMITNEENLHMLDGTYVEIDGIRIGGAMGWYDGKYGQANDLDFTTQNCISLQGFWNAKMSDAKGIVGIERFDELFPDEYAKMAKASSNCDVMMTHISPSLKAEHTHPAYRYNPISNFFSFDGEELLRKSSAKYWVFGHTHNKIEFQHLGVTVLSNPLGYPSQKKTFQPEMIEI